MIVYTTDNWRVDRCFIPTTQNSGRHQFFVDDRTGKNHYVANSLEAAKRWMQEQARKEDDMRAYTHLPTHYRQDGAIICGQKPPERGVFISASVPHLVTCADCRKIMTEQGFQWPRLVIG